MIMKNSAGPWRKALSEAEEEMDNMLYLLYRHSVQQRLLLRVIRKMEK